MFKDFSPLLKRRVRTATENAASFAVSARGTRLVSCVLGALVLFHLAATLGYSARLGRLSIVPYYDDVTYLVDALDRLKAFDRDGLLGLLRTFIREPPHAPITALIAAFGFAVTPDNRLGAYALGGAWVLLILALTAYILRRLPSASRAGVFCCVLALPILSLLIGSIRPDTAWGLLTGFVATILATVNLSEASRGRLFLIGALIGLTALSKPTGMPAAISIVGLAYLGAVAITLQDPRHESIRVIVRGTAMLGLGTAVVALPYFAVATGHVLEYIRTVMVEERDIWQTRGSLGFQLKYYLNDASFMIGWLWPFGILFLLGNGISRGCPVITTNLAGLAGVTASAATYLIDGNSVSQMAEAMRAVRAPEVRERLRRAGQDQAAELHRNNVVDALACNIESIHEEAENGVFTEFYSRWSKLRTLQSEVDIAT